MDQTRLENSISELANLLEAEISEEKEYQRYFEKNTVVFEVLGYDNAYSKPRFPLPDNEWLEPDFLVRCLNGLYEIFELKTPQERLIRPRKHRESFFAHVEEYVAQVETYSEYFDDSQNREIANNLYSFDIQKSPDMIVVVGLDAGVDKKLLHQLLRRRTNALRVITYDELLRTLLFYHAKFFGYSENLLGASVHIVIRLEELNVQRRKYIFDVGDDRSKNRWSIYLDEHDTLCFEIIAMDGVSHVLRLQPDSGLDFALGKRCYLCCEFGNSDRFSVLQILVNNRLGAKMQLSSPIAIKRGIDFDKRTIGADIEGHNNGRFGLYKLMVYDRILEFRDRMTVAERIFDKWFPDKNR